MSCMATGANRRHRFSDASWEVVVKPTGYFDPPASVSANGRTPESVIAQREDAIPSPVAREWNNRPYVLRQVSERPRVRSHSHHHEIERRDTSPGGLFVPEKADHWRCGTARPAFPKHYYAQRGCQERHPHGGEELEARGVQETDAEVVSIIIVHCHHVILVTRITSLRTPEHSTKPPSLVGPASR